MTRQEFYEKYGDLEVTFSHYYKFTFDFAAYLGEGKVVTVGVGGNAEDIYRFTVEPDTPVKISELEPYEGHVYEGTKEVESFYDY